MMLPRGKSFKGLTKKERGRQLSSLEGASIYASSCNSKSSVDNDVKNKRSDSNSVASSGGCGESGNARGACTRCASRRARIAELDAEFSRLRTELIGQVQNTPAEMDGDGRKFAGEETASKDEEDADERLALIQECAKLRITIDTLMRFQLFEATH